MIRELSNIKFLAEKNEFKNDILTSIVDGKNKEAISMKINSGHDKIIDEINENSNIQMIVKNKSNGYNRFT